DGGAPFDSHGICGARICRCRRVDELRNEPSGHVSSSRRLHRPHPQGGQAGRSAGAAIDQVRAGHQRPDRENARPHRAGGAAQPCRRGDRVKRRAFITLLGGAAVAWPLAARAQQAVKPVRVGYLSATSAPDAYMDIFRQGMGGLGYVEGRDFVIEARFAHRDYGRFPALVEELLSAKVVLIVMGGPASQAASFAEKSVPVVFGFSGDPVDAGIVSSFARPGGNATGISFLQLDLAPKRVDLLKEAVPAISKVAVLSNPDHAGDVSELRATSDAARQRGLVIQHFQVRADDSFEPA